MSEPFVIENLGSAAGIGGPSALLVEDGRITALDADAADIPAPRRLDGGGMLAVPGFIELQLNGAFGHDFTTEPDAMWRVGDGLARHGVTTFLPTIVTSAPGTVEGALDALAAAPSHAVGAVPLGLHVEGPYLAPERAGAHDPALIRDPDPREVKRWAKRGGVRLLTLAPERPGAFEAIGMLRKRGIVVAVGHTDADAATASAAVDAGARYATHLFNAMPPLGHRLPGAAGALLTDARVTVGLILDRHHLDPIVVSLVERLAHGRISLVSDAISALGLPEGSYQLGARSVEVQDGAVRLPDGTLAGSATPLDACMRAFSAMTGAVEEAIDAVTSTPARLLGLDDGRGALVAGGRADVVLLDDELEVQATLVGGEVAFAADALAWA